VYLKYVLNSFFVRAQGVFSVECKTVKKQNIFPTNSASWFTKLILLTKNEEYEQIDEQ
jgi:hypothetical protein